MAGAEGGFTQFYNNSTAANSVINSLAGMVNDAGSGQTRFSDSSTAGAATLFAEAGSGTAAGGSIIFFDQSSGGTARAIVNGGLDISLLTSTGMSIGSIEGGGIMSLGGKSLAVGSNNRSTVFSGLIRNGGFVNQVGGSLSVLGSGALTLTGANTYTGPTNIGNGVTANSGKLIAANIAGSATGTGTVFVNRGGTLSGSGHVAGPVVLRPGGAIAPGDPVTLNLQNSLTWDGGGVIRLVLGPDQAGSDLLAIAGAFIRGDAGEFRFELIDGGAVVGQAYDFLHFATLDGFTASDFTFGGEVEGNFAIRDGSVLFTVTSLVPEPGTAWLLALAALLLALNRQRPGARSEDLHRGTAAAVLGKPVEAVRTKDDRQLAKAVNFGLLYGQSAPGLVKYAASSYGVTLPEDGAKEIRAKFFRSYGSLRQWHGESHRQADKGVREIRTVLGRRRLIPWRSAPSRRHVVISLTSITWFSLRHPEASRLGKCRDTHLSARLSPSQNAIFVRMPRISAFSMSFVAPG